MEEAIVSSVCFIFRAVDRSVVLNPACMVACRTPKATEVLRTAGCVQVSVMDTPIEYVGRRIEKFG